MAVELSAAGAAVLRAARARVDLGRLARNYAAARAFAGRELMPVLKADAYGHGALPCARRLLAAGARRFAVAHVDEAVALRQGGIDVPLVVLLPFDERQAPALLEWSLTPVVSTPATLEQALRLARGARAPLPVHLKVDTGMTRLGLPAEAALEAARRLDAEPGVRLEGLMTHLASADEDKEATQEQLDRFDAVLAELARHGLRPPLVHAANSAGLACLRPTHTLARPGLLLYGLRPRPLSPALEVAPVMAVRAPIADVREVAPGTRVSYGGAWRAPRRARIATVLLGYADGVPRTQAMSAGGVFVVAGRRASVVGRVCMDMTLLDVSELPEARAGAEALFFGDEPTAWDVAERAGTNAWQVLTGVSARLPRDYAG